MNSIRTVQRLNQRELDTVTAPNASWHTDYRDTAYIYIGGLPLDLSEGDVITIFSQYGEPVWVRLMRDKETGKSRGFCWLKYEDQRSCDLAVDNLGGATVMGRLLAVDHTRYKTKDGDDDSEYYVGQDKAIAAAGGDVESEEDEEEEEQRPMLKEEVELQKLLLDHDDDDPMKAYMVQQKKEEVEEAKKALARKSERHGDRHRTDGIAGGGLQKRKQLRGTVGATDTGQHETDPSHQDETAPSRPSWKAAKTGTDHRRAAPEPQDQTLHPPETTDRKETADGMLVATPPRGTETPRAVAAGVAHRAGGLAIHEHVHSGKTAPQFLHLPGHVMTRL